MSKTTAVINEGFYSFVQERQNIDKVASIGVENNSDLYHSIAPIIPKVKKLTYSLVYVQQTRH